jgi:hypothetical protein
MQEPIAKSLALPQRSLSQQMQGYIQLTKPRIIGVHLSQGGSVP